MGSTGAGGGGVAAGGSLPGPPGTVLAIACNLICASNLLCAGLDSPLGKSVYAASTVGAEVPVPKRTAGPTAITTNCFPVFFPRYVSGVAYPLASSLVTQSSLPVCASNARKRRSAAAPLTTNPPAVTTEP